MIIEKKLTIDKIVFFRKNGTFSVNLPSLQYIFVYFLVLRMRKCLISEIYKCQLSFINKNLTNA